MPSHSSLDRVGQFEVVWHTMDVDDPLVEVQLTIVERLLEAVA
jgi:hypothetical protein